MDDLLEIIGVKKPEKSKPVFNPRMWQDMSIGQIHERLYDMSPRGFEELIEKLMHYLGYPNVKVTKRTGDGGIDVLSTRNTENGIERIAAQCKKYRNPVGVPIAREFYGAIHDDKSIVKGYLVTTSEFTSECISYCMRNKIELIPGIKIAEYVKQFGLEV
jgi:restriction system protein